ncbi:PadR family transcriptional regulator [Pseudonocardia acaciae]|uniref:PadR family transcriptional regulator n=1 Tax=Pseudonocardia acaciae TaxID=551276 RepID=UPI00048B1E21|nr:helix-turn-helix transcriptional regulator [Pseudonocardia acaciae]
MRRTKPLVKVAIVMMVDPNRRFWGYYLSREAGVRSGVLYPLLDRMLAEGWLTDGWEDRAEAVNRPPRRYYELTDDGRRELGATLARAETETRFAGLNWGYAR